MSPIPAPTPATVDGTTAESLGLGRYVAVGYGGNPTWIDPAAADWADVVANNRTWIQFRFAGGAAFVTTGVGDGSTGLAYQTTSAGFAEVFVTDGVGYIDAFSSAGASKTQIQVGPSSGQTAALIDLGEVFAVAPDGTVGGVAPTDGGAIRWNASLGKYVASAT